MQRILVVIVESTLSVRLNVCACKPNVRAHLGQRCNRRACAAEFYGFEGFVSDLNLVPKEPHGNRKSNHHETVKDMRTIPYIIIVVSWLIGEFARKAERLALILMMSATSMMCTYIYAECQDIVQVDLVINKVVYETEEGYVSTSKGIFLLPGSSTEIAMDTQAFTALIKNLTRLIGKQSIFYVHGRTVVGVASESQGFIFTPEYKKREKTIYVSPPLRISTILRYWDADTYRISARTIDGIFCVLNTFEVSDYYRKVYQKLDGHSKMQVESDIKVTILYHKIEDSYECQGEIEDIEFP